MDGWDRAGPAIDHAGGVCEAANETSTGLPPRAALDELVRTHGVSVRFKSNEIMRGPAGAPDLIYVITSGWAVKHRRLDDGSRQVLRILIPGDLSSTVSLFRGEAPRQYGVRTVSDLEACAIEMPRLQALIVQSHALRLALFEDLCEQINALEQRLTDLGVCGAPARIAQLLLDLHDRLDARGLVFGGAFQFPLRQEDIARAVGLTAVHANRTLMQLRRLGWIEYERGRMLLLNIDALRQSAAEPTCALNR